MVFSIEDEHRHGSAWFELIDLIRYYIRRYKESHSNRIKINLKNWVIGVSYDNLFVSAIAFSVIGALMLWVMFVNPMLSLILSDGCNIIAFSFIILMGIKAILIYHCVEGYNGK